MKVSGVVHVAEQEVVVVKATRPFLTGQPVLLDDPRPNAERLLATGTLQDPNFSDYLLFEATLVPSDRLYTSKREVLVAMNMQVSLWNSEDDSC